MFFLTGLLGRILVSGRIYYWSNYLFLAWFSLACVLALLVKRSSFRVPGLLKLGIGLFFGASIISMAFGLQPLSSARELIIFLGYLFIFLSALEIYSQRPLTGLVEAVILAAALHAIFGITQYAGGLERSISLGNAPELALFEQVKLKRIFGLTFSPDFFASILAAGLVLLAGAWDHVTSGLSRSKPARMAVSLVFSLLLLVPMLWSKSFGGFLSFAAGITALAAAKPRGGLTGKKAALLALGAGLLISATLAGFAYHRRSVILVPENNPVLQRIYNFESGLKVYREKPMLGVGIGNFGTACAKHRASQGNEARYAHNNFIQALAESGPAALLGLLLIAAWLLLSLRKVLAGGAPLAAGLWAGAIVMLSHWLWDYGLYVPEAAAVFFALAAGLAASLPGREERKVSPPVLGLVSVLVAALWLASGWIFLEHRAMKKAERFFLARDWAQSKALAEKALRLIPLDDYPEMLIAWNLSQAGAEPAKVIPHFSKAIQLNPRSASWHKELGAYYLSINRLQPAEAEFRKALELYPNSPDLMARLARVRRLQGDIQGCQSLAQKALTVAGDHKRALWEIFWASMQQGEGEKAAEALRQLQALGDNSAARLLERIGRKSP